MSSPNQASHVRIGALSVSWHGDTARLCTRLQGPGSDGVTVTSGSIAPELASRLDPFWELQLELLQLLGGWSRQEILVGRPRVAYPGEVSRSIDVAAPRDRPWTQFESYVTVDGAHMFRTVSRGYIDLYLTGIGGGEEEWQDAPSEAAEGFLRSKELELADLLGRIAAVELGRDRPLAVQLRAPIWAEETVPYDLADGYWIKGLIPDA